MINKAQVLGRVGKIEIKTTGNGIKITNLSMVTNKKYTKNGEKQEKTTWHNVTCFSKLAEIAENYVNVGDVLFIEGEMDNQKFTTQDGQERIKFHVIAHELQLMPNGRKSDAKPKTEAPAFQDDDVPW